MGQKSFLAGILWVQNFSCGYFPGSNIFSRGYYVGAILVFVANFVIQRFSVVG